MMGSSSGVECGSSSVEALCFSFSFQNGLNEL